MSAWRKKGGKYAPWSWWCRLWWPWQGWHKCAFSYISECGPSQHYASTAMCVPVVQCNKTTQRHLQTIGCGDDCGIDLPEGLLILCRSGIFVIDTSVVNCQICPRHRDDLGVYWKRQKRTCQAPTHPANSSAKCARGIQASRCKEFWLKSRTFLAVGAGKNLINRKSLCT